MALTPNWRKRWLVWCLIVGVLLAVTLPAALAQPDDVPHSAAEPLSKISTWVLAHTANDAQAEMLVVLNQQADLSGAAQKATKLEKGRYVYDTLYKTAQATQGPIIQWLTARGLEYRAYYIVNLIWVKADRVAALELAARSDVARIDGNPQIRVPLPTPTVSVVNQSAPNVVELGVTYIHAPEVWALGYTGQGIVVGGQDTGIQWDHPALINHYRGWNGTTANHDYNWHDSIHTTGSSCGANSPVPCDDYGHGTHTIGTAVGSDSSTNEIGVAPGAKFIGCRNMNAGNGTPATYIECFEFFLAPYPVAGTPAQGDPSQAPDVTNNSWGCPPSEGCNAASLLAAVQAQRAAGIMTVASSGNYGSACSSTKDPIAIYDETYTVGNLDASTGQLSSSSSRGPVTIDGSGRLKPDIAAPGTSVRSAYPGNGYTLMSGTSMASPHVAGAVALLWSAQPMLRNNLDLTEQILNQSAVHVDSAGCFSSGTWPNNLYGYGRLNIKAAVDLASLGISGLHGTVTDALSAAPIVNAAITATASVTLSGYTKTTVAGVYSLSLLSGVYTVEVAAWGYVPAQLTGVIAMSGTLTPLDVALTPSVNQPNLTPSAAAQQSTPGTVVPYDLVMENLSDYTHTYTLTAQADWPTVLSTEAITMSPKFTSTLLVSVTIPLTVTNGQIDAALISMTGSNGVATSTLTTTARFNQPGLVSSVAALPGLPDTVVAYDLVMENLSDYTHTYTLTAQADWPTALSTEAITLAPQFTSTLLVSVTIPLTVTNGQFDVAKIAMTGDNGVATSALTTTAHFSLPQLAPSVAAALGAPGTDVTYNLVMENVGTETTVYTLTAQADWPTVLSTAVITMSPQLTSSLTVSVTIPLTVTSGQTDTATIWMTGDNGTATSTLTTTADWPYVWYLPVIRGD